MSPNFIYPSKRKSYKYKKKKTRDVLPRFAVAQYGWLDEKSVCSRKLCFRHCYQCRPFPPPHLRVLEVHINNIRGITIHITGFKIHISYSENHDSTLMLVFYYFYMSPLQTSSIWFDDTKLQKNSFDVSSTGSFPFPKSMGTHIRRQL